MIPKLISRTKIGVFDILDTPPPLLDVECLLLWFQCLQILLTPSFALSVNARWPLTGAPFNVHGWIWLELFVSFMLILF